MPSLKASRAYAGFLRIPRPHGGGWIYGLKNNVISIGYVTGSIMLIRPSIRTLSSRIQDNPTAPNIEGRKCSSTELRPSILRLLYDAEAYAAAYAGGRCASFLTDSRIKGIHTGMTSGMLAAKP